MKIRYIDGNRLYLAFLAGGRAVINQQDYLNKINVFPVPDSDTGTNMASTIRSIVEGTHIYPSIKDTFRSIADAALMGARGNSGIIFAQFIHGLSSEIKNEKRISSKKFAQSIANAVKYAYESILEPVEGTMLTVIKDWATAMVRFSQKTNDLFEILLHSHDVAKKSLRDTPKKLKALADAGVVDSGAKGFVDFLGGIISFISNGKLQKLNKKKLKWQNNEIERIHDMSDIKYQFCTEAFIEKSELAIKAFQQHFSQYGDSLVVAGSQEKMHLHIHTNNPADLFYHIKDYGTIKQIKVDDMKKQAQVSHDRKHSIALVTDSACDLPNDLIQKHQIHLLPFQISFGENLFLDKVTMTPDHFYKMLTIDKHHPKSSQPTLRAIQNLYSFLSSHYQSIISLHISDKLSGVFQQSIKAAEMIKNKKISVLNSRHLSVSQGLITLRIAQAIEKGYTHKKIINHMDEWIQKTNIYVDINTLKYMVRGGRISPLKGFIAKLFNLKPIVSLDSDGKGIAFGKSFSRKANMKKILNILTEIKKKGKVWNYAIVHSQVLDRAQIYAEKLTPIFGKEPAYIVDISPVIGVHNGIGALAVAMMYE